MLTSFVQAQRVTLDNDGQYKPGVYTALRIEADSAGPISIRGPQMLGIDWNAPGKTSITVPWMCWRTTAGEVEISINDRKQLLALRPTTSDLPPEHLNAEVYRRALDWVPGQPASKRRWIMLASIALLLSLATLRLTLWRWKYSPLAAAVGGIALACAFAAFPMLSRTDASKSEPRKKPDGSSELWIYRTASTPQRVSEPWRTEMEYVPMSAASLQAADPSLNVNSTGNVTELLVNVDRDRPACLLIRAQ